MLRFCVRRLISTVLVLFAIVRFPPDWTTARFCAPAAPVSASASAPPEFDTNALPPPDMSIPRFEVTVLRCPTPLFEAIIKHCPPPDVDAEGPLQLQVSQLDYSSYVGAIGIGR